jgi:hypothetical protein
MQIRLELITAAVTGFAIVALYQAWFLSRAMKHVIDENARVRTNAVEGWAKLIRQDVAGITVGIGIANGLLGAIVAILIFR